MSTFNRQKWQKRSKHRKDGLYDDEQTPKRK